MIFQNKTRNKIKLTATRRDASTQHSAFFFALLTALGMIVSILGILTKTQIWMIMVAITSIGFGLVFILLGVVVALTTEIEQHQPDRKIVESTNLGPSLGAAKVQKSFGYASMVAVALGIPAVIVLIDILLAVNGTIR